MRPSRRAPDELRAVSLERGVVKYAEQTPTPKDLPNFEAVKAALGQA